MTLRPSCSSGETKPWGQTYGRCYESPTARHPGHVHLAEGPKQLLGAYLKERVSGDADAPHRGLPLITEAGALRVNPGAWLAWLEQQGIAAPKR
ncbi:MAG TPA: hypothetical protein VFI54_11555 [Solirubrobacteraceae bacterium]|nr:hypothetical protein [Solirubrobacteraceae bacterium]